MRGSTLMMACAASLLGTAAIAQMPATAQPGAAQGDAAAFRGPSEAEMMARHEAERARRDADVAVVLELWPKLQALFHAMLADRRGPHGDEPHGRPPHGPGPMSGAADEPKDRTFAQHLQDAQTHLDEHTREAQARLSDAKAFYASLSARQQQKFDALTRLQHGPMRDGPMHGGPMHEGPMHEGAMHDGPPPPPPGDGRGPPPPGGPDSPDAPPSPRS